MEKNILLGFATQRKEADGKVVIKFRWGRLMAAGMVMFVSGWVSVAALLYAHFKYRGDFDDVTFTDMLMLPFTLDQHRQKMGDFHCQKGLHELKSGNFRDGLRLLRLGIARSKGNIEGRIAVAEIFEFGLKRHEKSVEILVEGLAYGGSEDPDYIKATIRTLLRHQMDEAIQEIAVQYLPAEPELTERNQILAFGAAQANFLRGNYDRSEDYLIDYNLKEALEGLLLSAQISWDRGNHKSAITKLEKSINRFPNAETLYLKLSQYYRELEDLDQARRYAILRNVSDPMSAAPRIELLYIYNLSGDSKRETRETRRMLRQFRDDEKSLFALANFAANSGNVALAQRTYEQALENEFSIDLFALALIEAQLKDEDFAGAFDFSEELMRERPAWLTKNWAIFQSLRSVASYGFNRPDLGEIYLQDFMKEGDVAPSSLLVIAKRFVRIDRSQQARRILSAAYKAAPTNQKILSELIKVELDLGYTEDLNDLLSSLLQMRRPQLSILTEAYKKLGSDRFIFTSGRENLLLELSAVLQQNEYNLEKFSQFNEG